MQLAHDLDYFIRSSASIEPWFTGTIHKAEEEEKIAFEAKRRASKTKYEALRANSTHTEAINEAKCLGRILKKAEGRATQQKKVANHA